jgi:hypothetical protein
MGKTTSALIDECSAVRLKELLALGAREKGEDDSLLPIRIGDLAEIARLLTEVCGGEQKSGDLLLSAAADPATPVEALRGMKDLSKQLLEQAGTDPHRNAATLLYHAAVAAAFARHGINISTRPLQARRELYEDLAIVLAGEPLGTVFQAAVDRLGKSDDSVP